MLTGLLVLTACTAVPDATPPPDGTTTPAATPAARSQAALDDLVGDAAQPGCTAAVGERGRAVWQGVHGLADVEERRPLTPDSGWAGFDTAFLVSPDRSWAVALTCLQGELEPTGLALELLEIWAPT